jgi:hypothetical protein
MKFSIFLITLILTSCLDFNDMLPSFSVDLRSKHIEDPKGGYISLTKLSSCKVIDNYNAKQIGCTVDYYQGSKAGTFFIEADLGDYYFESCREHELLFTNKPVRLYERTYDYFERVNKIGDVLIQLDEYFKTIIAGKFDQQCEKLVSLGKVNKYITNAIEEVGGTPRGGCHVYLKTRKEKYEFKVSMVETRLISGVQLFDYQIGGGNIVVKAYVFGDGYNGIYELKVNL